MTYRNDGRFPDDSMVEVKYPLSAEQERGDRDGWPWLPATVRAQCGPDEWLCVVEHDSETTFPVCFRSAGEMRPATCRNGLAARRP